MIRLRPLLGIALAGLLAACGGRQEQAPATSADEEADEKVLNLFIWNNYLARDTLANFRKETGIEVSVSYYGSNEELDGRLAAGNSGFDVVVPSASFYERQIKAGYYQKLDKSKLPNLSNMDADIQKRLAQHDPGNEYAVLHMWGTTGIGYNTKKIQAAFPKAPVNSWRLVFDPAVAERFRNCGIAMLDSPSEMFSMVLSFLGKDPNSQNPADIAAAGAAMQKFRPYVRYFDTQRMIADLANGEMCAVVGYSGDILQARTQANLNKTRQNIAYAIPTQGTIIWFDSYLIPKDAPNPDNAHVFINYMLRPEVIAAVTNAVHYANGNLAATQFVDPEVLSDPGVYPPPGVRAKLFPDLADTEETTRQMTRLWTKVVTGR